jgi:hypothetical protein
MPNKQMRQMIKMEDGKEEVQPHEGAGQGEEADAGWEPRRREDLAAATDETRAALVEAQAHAFREMEHARVMELQLQQAKLHISRLGAQRR